MHRAEHVRLEQIRLTMERGRIANRAAVPMALLLVWYLWGYVPQGLLLGWLAAKLVVAAGRELIAVRYFSSPAPSARLLRWIPLAYLADGLVWSALGTVLYPAGDELRRMAMLMVLFGVVSMAMVVTAPQRQAGAAFSAGALVPTFVLALAQGTLDSSPVGRFEAAVSALFFVLAQAQARKSDRFMRDTITMRIQLDALAEERRVALEQAQRDSAAKDRFLATMSHEMRTPLHGLLGVTRLLRLEMPAPSPGAATAAAVRLDLIEQAGKHLLGLIDDVLDFTRLGSGRLRLVSRSFDLAALLDSVLAIVAVSATDKGLALRSERQPGLPPHVVGDPSRLRQILLNLCGNAVKFTAKGEIVLSARRGGQDGWLWFEVRDTGGGVPAAKRELVFEAFEQLDDSDARQNGGIGLGLPISRELARAMGGDLSLIASGEQAPAQGSVFRLELPLPPGPAPSAPPDTRTLAPTEPLVNGRVLLAEDNPVNALVAQALLQRLGLQVAAVDNGVDAVQEALEHAPDIILMDCQMPGLDGFEAARRIRAAEAAAGLGRRVPIVALTAGALAGDRERCLAAGMDDHLPKPFHHDELAHLLRRHLQRPATWSTTESTVDVRHPAGASADRPQPADTRMMRP